MGQCYSVNVNYPPLSSIANNSDAVIQKCGELLCAVYAPFVMLLLVAIFV